MKIFDIKRGEIIDTETGEVLEERLPMPDAKYNIVSVSDKYYKSRRMLPSVFSINTKSKIYFDVSGRNNIIEIKIAMVNEYLMYKNKATYTIILDKTRKNIREIDINELRKKVIEKIREVRKKAKRTPHLISIVFLAIIDELIAKRIISTLSLSKKSIRIFRDENELSANSILKQLYKIKKKYGW